MVRMKISDEMVEKAVDTFRVAFDPTTQKQFDVAARAVLETVLSDPREVAEAMGGEVFEDVTISVFPGGSTSGVFDRGSYAIVPLDVLAADTEKESHD